MSLLIIYFTCRKHQQKEVSANIINYEIPSQQLLHHQSINALSTGIDEIILLAPIELNRIQQYKL